MMSEVQGGNFWTGFASGCLASVASSAWGGGTTTENYNFRGYEATIETSHQGLSGALGMNNSWGTLAFGTVSGGAGASLTGGNFWQGAVMSQR
ncbi:MAG: hypothetical protein M0D53_16830 [Flavobacterium sp. JAD_PAG50586_2]|nr:MAG: hypothetical protein M0D53_16830 [Flavobacterium sp. JAD_PAG50586_2]